MALPTDFVDGVTVIGASFLNQVSQSLNNLDTRLDGYRSAHEFGAKGDGVADDTPALQAALNARVPVVLPVGTYRITSELVFSTGSKLVGQGNWSAVSSNFMFAGTSAIVYDGPGGTNSCVLRLSTAAVGVELAGDQNLQNVQLSNLVVSGGDKAEIGIYMVRAWSNNVLDYLTVTRTLKHGFLALKCWNGSPTNWMAYKNLGAGITLGENLWNWAGGSNVDQSTCTSFFGYFCGHNFSTVAQNTFHEATNPKDSYGIGLFACRAILLLNAQGAQNGGAGLFVANGFHPTDVVGGYFEGNGKSSGATRDWDIWVDGAPSGGSWSIKFEGVHLGLDPAVRLTGTAPSRLECGVQFVRMPALKTIDADWSNFRLVDCNRNAVFVNRRPTWFRGSVNGHLNLGVSGVAAFDASTGTLNKLLTEGLIADITRVSTGTYEVTLAETFSSARYAVSLSGGDNRIVGTGSLGPGSFQVLNRSATGALTDSNSRISVMVTGYYA